MERLREELADQLDFYRLEVDSSNPEHWAQVREHFRVGPRLPLLVLYALGRWQRTLQGPAPAEVVRAFLTGPLSFDAAGANAGGLPSVLVPYCFLIHASRHIHLAALDLMQASWQGG